MSFTLPDGVDPVVSTVASQLMDEQLSAIPLRVVVAVKKESSRLELGMHKLRTDELETSLRSRLVEDPDWIALQEAEARIDVLRLVLQTLAR